MDQESDIASETALLSLPSGWPTEALTGACLPGFGEGGLEACINAWNTQEGGAVTIIKDEHPENPNT